MGEKDKKEMTTACLMIEEIMGKGNLANRLLKGQKADLKTVLKNHHLLYSTSSNTHNSLPFYLFFPEPCNY